MRPEHRRFWIFCSFRDFLLFSIANVLASLTNEIKTILADPFINVPVDELNNLNTKQVNDILIEDIGDKIPESEDNIVENYIDSLKHVIETSDEYV